MNHPIKLSFALAILFSSLVHGKDSLPIMEALQMPQCLAAHLPAEYNLLAENKEFKIIQVPSTDVEHITLLADKIHCGHFINVTEDLKHQTAAGLLSRETRKIKKTSDTGWSLQHPEEVETALNEVQLKNIMHTLTRLTHFKNRSSTRKTGLHTAQWLKSQFVLWSNQSKRVDVDTFFVSTGEGYIQPSLVTVLGKDIKAPAVVIGAHMDTLDGNMPGAGDDASGSAALMEAARVLMGRDVLKHPVYFIWYAAEERGLVGSQQVVRYFEKHQIPVKAVLQLDMAGFRNNPEDPTLWIYRDYTDPALTDFTAQLINIYLNVPVAESECGYGCSDHASWTAKGIPAAFPCETDFEHHNQAIHTAHDTLDKLTPEHILNFTKLAVAFAVELAIDSEID